MHKMQFEFRNIENNPSHINCYYQLEIFLFLTALLFFYIDYIFLVYNVKK